MESSQNPEQFTLSPEPEQLQPSQTPPPQLHNPLSVMQPGEQIICEIKRHPIGMLGIYLGAGTILVVLAVLAFVALPNIINADNRSQVLAGTGIAFVIVAAMVLVFVLISNIIYWGNNWVVTSDSITQVTQTGLFSKQSAQLSLGNLEDITSEQNGILAQLFNFGVLKAETAGERSKFMFLFCPNPNYYAQKILAAREIFERDHHGGKQIPYVAPVVPVAAPQSSSGPDLAPPPPDSTAENQYQVGQTPPNFNTPPTQSQIPVFPNQPPNAAPSRPADDYANSAEPGASDNANHV
jgi:hypothetical protein